MTNLCRTRHHSMPNGWLGVTGSPKEAGSLEERKKVRIYSSLVDQS